MTKETFYFSHDYNARSDEKIKKLLMKYGFLGYGIFWAIVEDLYQNANAMQTDYDLLAFEYRTQSDIVESIINDFNLFVIKDNEFGSLSVQSRLDDRDAKSKKARQSAKTRWEKQKNNANALRTQTECNAIYESKVKESKVNKSKEEEEAKKPPKQKPKRFLSPTLNEVINYFKENGYKEDSAIKAWNYYEAGNWKDSNGTQVKNWKQKMHGVWFKPENILLDSNNPISTIPEWVKKAQTK